MVKQTAGRDKLGEFALTRTYRGHGKDAEKKSRVR